MGTSKAKQSILFLATIGIVLFFLYSYFFIYVKNKEEYVNQRNYKVLVRIAKNLKAKIEEYRTKDVTKNFIKNNTPGIGEKSLKELVKSNIKNNPINQTLNLTLDSMRSGVKGKADTLQHQHNPWTLIFIDTVISTAYTAYVTYSSIPAGKFIEPELRRDIFSEYFVLEGDSSHHYAEIYSTTPLGLTDSLRKKIVNKCPDEITLNGITYKAFCFATTFDHEPCVLFGLQHEDQYIAETRGLERPMLYTLIFVTILLLLAIPLIKVILISKNEKLNKADVVWVGISLLAGCFLCTLLILNSTDKLSLDHSNDLEALADSIEGRFKSEVDSAFRELIAADAMMKLKMGDHAFDAINLLATAVNEYNDKETLEYKPRFKNFLNIFWTDFSGMQKTRWTVFTKNSNKINISDREYFRAIVDGTAWTQPSTTELYFLESIRSWNTSQLLGAISKKSETSPDLAVVAIISYLPSVINATVPLGYKFCITDLQGNVLFHSDATRNLNENIFDELNLKNDIQEILYGHFKRDEAVYENKPHEIFMRPLKDIPLYLITMKDKTVDIQSKTFILEITIFFLGLHGLLILVAILALRITRPRNPWYRVHRADLEWLKPDDDQQSLYIKTTLLNLAIVILTILFISFQLLSAVEEIFICLVIPFFIIPCYFLNMNRKYNNKPLRLWDKANRLSIITVATLVLVGNMILAGTVGLTWRIGVFESILLFMVLDFNYGFKTKPKDQSFTRTWYGFSLASLLLLVGIVPTVIFYSVAYNHEQLLKHMSAQYDLAKKYREPSAATKVLPHRYTIHTQVIRQCPENGDDGASALLADKDFCNLWQISHAIRGNLGENFLVRKKGFYVYTGDVPGTWKKRTGTLLFRVPAHKKNEGLLMESPVRFFSFPPPHQSPAFWFIALLGITYLLVFTRFLVTRIFIFDKNKRLIEADHHLLMKNENPDFLPEEIRKENILNHLFVIGLPFSGKKEYLDKLYPPAYSKRFAIDLILLHVNNQWQSVLKEASQEAIEVVIVDHFEYDFENKEISNLKLSLFEKLFLLKNKKIVIISTIHAQQMLEVYGRNQTQPELERWNAVLSHFYELYYPLKINIDENYSRASTEKRQSHEELFNFVELECSHGLFMQNLKPTMYSLIESSKEKLSIKELSDKIGSLAASYYLSIWSTCSKDERFLIYDLAEDGLVNSKNADSITRLLYKGIFTRDNTLSLMNTSFRSFVLSYIIPEQQVAFRTETARVGSWSRIRGPIFTLLGLTALFLLYTQKGFSAQVTGFFGALGAIIPILLRILESMGQSKGSSKST